MTTYDLMIKVKEALEEKGFTTDSIDDYSRQAWATKDDKCKWTPVEGWDFTRLNGFRIDFNVVHRSNGTDENVSVDINVYEWKDSSGQRITKERINTKMGEKAIVNRINKIVEIYETL